jgi:AcrR family transcriptional regulator
MPTKSSDNKLSREEIVASVAELIADNGLETLTMRNIAGHVGCSVGTLPHYFEGKDDIVNATFNWSSDRILSRLGNMPESEIHLENLYPLLSTSMPIDELSDKEWRVRLCLWDYATTNEDMRLTLNSMERTVAELLASLVIHLQELGEIRKELEPNVTALSIYHMCIGAGFNMLHTPIEGRQKQLAPLFNFIDSISTKA